METDHEKKTRGRPTHARLGKFTRKQYLQALLAAGYLGISRKKASELKELYEQHVSGAVHF